MNRQLVALSALLALVVGLGACERSKKAGAVPTRFTRVGTKAVFLAGQFNDWSATATPMRRIGDDEWTVDLPLPPGTYQYKFVVDGQWERDLANPDTAPDGWGDKNSVVTVPPHPVRAVSYAKQNSAPPTLRKDVRWKRIWYPDFPIPGAEGRTITGFVSGGTSDFEGQPERLRFDLLFYEPADAEQPAALSHPEQFQVRMHLASGEVIVAKGDPDGNWNGVGNQTGMSMSRAYFFPWAQNAYDEAWIEWRLPGHAFWFEVPYGFTRNPVEPWPPAEAKRSEPTLASAMQSLSETDRLVPWRYVEYEIGEIQNHWRLSAQMANPFRPAAEVTLYQAPGENLVSWRAEKPETSIQIKGSREGARIGFRKRGLLERIDTFRLGFDGSDRGREAASVVVRVDDRSYEFIVPSSLFKYVHGTAAYENKQRLPRGDGLFEALVRLAD